MVKGAVTTWHMTNHMTRHMTRHVTRHVTRPRVARPRGGDRVAVAVWRWPCGGHMTCHMTWKDNPLRVTPLLFRNLGEPPRPFPGKADRAPADYIPLAKNRNTLVPFYPPI